MRAALAAAFSNYKRIKDLVFIDMTKWHVPMAKPRRAVPEWRVLIRRYTTPHVEGPLQSGVVSKEDLREAYLWCRHVFI